MNRIRYTQIFNISALFKTITYRFHNNTEKTRSKSNVGCWVERKKYEQIQSLCHRECKKYILYLYIVFKYCIDKKKQIKYNYFCFVLYLFCLARLPSKFGIIIKNR